MGVRKRIQLDEESGNVEFRCPGCGDIHILNIDPAVGRPLWSFNGDLERPTISPSILSKSGHYASGQHGDECWCNYEERLGKPAPFSCGICHSFVTDGRIQFLNDCTHALAGQTVELPYLEEEGWA